MLNITVRIFSYGVGGDEARTEWREVSPDPVMAEAAQFPKGWVPDMCLYNSDQTHYDLLVAENHRLAFLGLVSGKAEKVVLNDSADVMDEPTDRAIENHGWKNVEKKKKHENQSDQVLMEDIDDEYDEIDLEELDEEIVLTRSKQSGGKRTNPTSPPQMASSGITLLKCTWENCKMQLESKGLLTSHMKEHRPTYNCNLCENEFLNENELKQHMQADHTKYMCEQCGKEYKTKEELKNHINEKHTDKD